MSETPPIDFKTVAKQEEVSLDTRRYFDSLFQKHERIQFKAAGDDMQRKLLMELMLPYLDTQGHLIYRMGLEGGQWHSLKYFNWVHHNTFEYIPPLHKLIKPDYYVKSQGTLRTAKDWRDVAEEMHFMDAMRGYLENSGPHEYRVGGGTHSQAYWDWDNGYTAPVIPNYVPLPMWQESPNITIMTQAEWEVMYKKEKVSPPIRSLSPQVTPSVVKPAEKTYTTHSTHHDERLRQIARGLRSMRRR
jgi:hypothetical protein